MKRALLAFVTFSSLFLLPSAQAAVCGEGSNYGAQRPPSLTEFITTHLDTSKPVSLESKLETTRLTEGWESWQADFTNHVEVCRAQETAERLAAEQADNYYDGGESYGVIPASVIACESGGSYTALNADSGAYGRYQIMPMHYVSGGICAGMGKTPGEQDACAARILSIQGPGAWDCW